MQDEKTIVIDINLNRGLVALLALALLMAAFLGYLTWGQREAAASGPQASLDHPFDLAQGRAQDRPLDHAQAKPLAASSGLRQYYLTTDLKDGAGTLTACASGYHFASLWEILDPSKLKYNTTLGSTRDDGGQGPPSSGIGWVRTGYSSSTSTTPGVGNCNVWTSSSSLDYGTTADLPHVWTTGQDIHVWEVSTTMCYSPRQVWCVED